MNDIRLMNVVDPFNNLYEDSQGVLELEDLVGLGELISIEIAQLAVLHD